MQIDYPVAAALIAFGAVCWLGGWHSSIRGSGEMYDDGFRAGYRAGRESGRDEPASGAGNKPERG